jgi:arylsulfatase A-like enzyme
MNRRQVLFLATGTYVFSRQVFAAGRKSRPPNIIVILVDDMGWRDTGFAGNTYIQTPHLDLMAKRGIVFSRAYAAAPNCAPTRACLMTGQYTPRHGVYNVVDDRHAPGAPHHKIIGLRGRSELPSNTCTIAEVLKKNGYSTGMVGMWNLGRGRRGPNTPTGRGFDSYIQPKDLGFDRDDYFNSRGEYLTDAMTDSGIDFIKRHRDHPFFLYMAYHAVHSPFDPRPKLLEKYKGLARGRNDDPEMAATVEALDQNIGELTDALEGAGLDKNTYIFFTSDNGGTQRYITPLRGGKGTLYEGGIRVPAMAVGPGIVAGRVTDQPISTIDIYPTLLEIAGAAADDSHVPDGISLLPLMMGKTNSLKREKLFWHFPCYVGRGTPCSAIREGHYKLLEFFETSAVELYDLSKDPGETRDLSRSQPELASRLKEKLHKLQKELGAPRPDKPNPQYDPKAQRHRGRGRRKREFRK